MKNVQQKLLSVIAIVMVLAITSCGGDDSTPSAELPSLSVSATVGSASSSLANGGDVTAGESVVFTVNATAPGGFSFLDVSGSITQQVFREDLGLAIGATTTGDFTITATTTEANIDGTAVVGFVVFDDLNQQSDTTTFSFNIVGIPAQVISQVFLAPPSSSASLAFYSIANEARHSHSEVIATASLSDAIDIGYYYTAADMASISAPSAYPASVLDISSWSTRKGTAFWTTDLTSTDWMNINTTADVESAFAATTSAAPGNTLTGLAAGDIFAFQTDDTQPIRGFVLVVAINGTSGASDSIELDFILNQPSD